MMPQRLNIDDGADKSRAVHGALLADDGTSVVYNHRLAAAGVDWHLAVSIEVIGRKAGREDVEIVLERPGPIRNLEGVALRKRRRQRAAVHYLGAVHGEAAAVFGVVAFHRHHDAEPADHSIGHRPEGVEGA